MNKNFDETVSNKNTYFGIELPTNSDSEIIKKFILLSILSPYFTFVQVKRKMDEIKCSQISIQVIEAKLGMLSLKHLKRISSVGMENIVSKIKSWEKTYGRINDSEFDEMFSLVYQLEEFFPDRCVIAPKKIALQLEKFVIGQAEPIKAFSVYLYKIMKYWEWQKQNLYPLKPNSSALILGKTGTGKTHLLHTASKIFDFSFIEIDASRLTAEGYVGNNLVTEILMKYEQLSNREKVIIFIDEFDKLAGTWHDASDVKGSGVLIEMLKLLESEEISGTSNYTKDGSRLTISTKNIFFVLGGAFSGIKKQKNDTPIGFNNADAELGITEESKISVEDIYNYGIPREICGRIGDIIELNDISKEMLLQILESENFEVLNYYRQFFKNHNKHFALNSDKIAEDALKKNIGARGLFQALNEYFNDKIANIAS